MAERSEKHEPWTPSTIVELEEHDTGKHTEEGPTEEKGLRVSSAQNDTQSETTTVADHEPAQPEEPDLERIESVKLPLVKVPRSQRRGLFARFAAIAEVTEPHHYSNKTKWLVTFIVAIAAAAAPVGSSIILPTLDQVGEDLHASPTITNLSVALYMLSM